MISVCTDYITVIQKKIVEEKKTLNTQSFVVSS